MLSGDRFEIEAIVVAAVSERALRARLSNGHEFVARVPRQGLESRTAGFKVGDRVRALFSPADLTKARIIVD